MNDLFVGDEKLISTPRASEISGYSKDYIGQLCREDKVECRRVSGQWYVDEDSLKKYKIEGAQGDGEDIETKKPAHGIKVGNVRDDTFNYDGVEYIATSRAATLTGYAQDYVGQLARESEIQARKVGRRWFVGKKSLLEHKKHNDSLLAQVQAEASGVRASIAGTSGNKSASTEDTQPAVKTERYAHVEPGNINFNVTYVAEGNQKVLPKISSDNAFRSTSYASDDIEPISIKKPALLPVRTQVAATLPQKRTFPDYAAKNMPSRSDGIVPSRVHSRINAIPGIAHRSDSQNVLDKKVVPVQKKQHKGHPLLITLVLGVLSMVSIGSYVYYYGVPSLPVVTDTRIQGGIELLRDRYGEIVPGATFEYKKS